MADGKHPKAKPQSEAQKQQIAQLKQLLKEHVSIDVNTDNHRGDSVRIKVAVRFDGEVIAEDSAETWLT